MRKVLIAGVLAGAYALAVSPCLFAADITWSGGNGFWGTKANWMGGVVPVALDTVIFPIGGYTVDIDKSTAGMVAVVVESGVSDQPLVFRDTAMRRLIVANGENSGYTPGFTVGSGRNVVIDGIELSIGKYRNLEICKDSTFTLDSGKVTLNYGNMVVNTNAVLNVNGGTLHFGADALYLKLAKNSVVNFNGGSNVIGRLVNKISDGSEFDGEGSKVTFAGGYVRFPDEYAIYKSFLDWSKIEIDFTGGILDFNSLRATRDTRVLMPPKGGEFRSSSKGEALTDVDGVNDIWKIGGRTIFSADNSYAKFGWAGETKFEGGGDLFVNAILLGPNTNNVDLGSINISSNFVAYSHRGMLNFVDGIKFGAYGDVGVETKKSAVFVPYGRLQFDTLDAFDGETPRSFDLHSRFYLSNVTSLEVQGNGSVSAVSQDDMGYLRRFSVDDGAVVSLTNSHSVVKASIFSLGAGARFDAGTNLVDVAESVEIGNGAKIRFTFDSLQGGKMYPLWFGPHGTLPPVENFEFIPALPEGWTVAVHGSTAYLSDGTVHEVDTLDSRSYWIGAEGGNWNVSANWTTNGTAKNVPGEMTSLASTFSGNRQLAVTNDWPKDFAWMRNIVANESAGPYVISGKPLATYYPQDWTTSSSSVGSSSRFPFVIESMMYRYWFDPDHTQQSFFSVLANSDAPIVLAGGGSLTNAVFRFRGDVRIGGEWETLGLFPVSGGGRETRFMLLPGANLLATEQGSNQIVKASYHVSAGSSMTLEGDVWRWINNENTHFVDGVVTSACPVQATARQTFIGDGALAFWMVQSDPEGASELKFMEDATICLGGWKTVRADADNAMRMVVRDNVTIGALRDWTYGPEAGFESETEASARALTVIGGAKTRVKFDTEGHTVTLADPLSVEKWSTVVKQGEGALVLASSDNKLDDSEFELLEGDLKLAEFQSFGKLTFGGGKIALGDDFTADSYELLFTAKEIVGDVAVSGRIKARTIRGDEGVSVFVRRERGTAVVIR